MTLYLLPNVLADEVDHHFFLPSSVDEAMKRIDGLIAESAVGGRRYLKRFQSKKPPYQIPSALMREPLDFLLEPVQKGESWGVVSDAGLPCLADPGAHLVRKAQELGVLIQTFAGPSSITLSLILSGLPAQRFAFHGYLSKEPAQRREQILVLQKRSLQEKSTEVFIEAPYRNQHTFETCVEALRPETFLGVAVDLTSPTQLVKTQTIASWRKAPLVFEKRPMIFLINSKL